MSLLEHSGDGDFQFANVSFSATTSGAVLVLPERPDVAESQSGRVFGKPNYKNAPPGITEHWTVHVVVTLQQNHIYQTREKMIQISKFGSGIKQSVSGFNRSTSSIDRTALYAR